MDHKSGILMIAMLHHPRAKGPFFQSQPDKEEEDTDTSCWPVLGNCQSGTLGVARALHGLPKYVGILYGFTK